jgi:hypothetical protein
MRHNLTTEADRARVKARVALDQAVAAQQKELARQAKQNAGTPPDAADIRAFIAVFVDWASELGLPTFKQSALYRGWRLGWKEVRFMDGSVLGFVHLAMFVTPDGRIFQVGDWRARPVSDATLVSDWPISKLRQSVAEFEQYYEITFPG